MAQRLAKTWKIPGATDDWKRVLPDVDGIVLAVPNHLHHPMTVEALRRRKAVLCEKPLGRTAEEVRQMVAAASEAGPNPLTNESIVVAAEWKNLNSHLHLRHFKVVPVLPMIQRIRSRHNSLSIQIFTPRKV